MSDEQNTPAANRRKLREIREAEALTGQAWKGHDPTKKQPKGNETFKRGHGRHFVKR